MKSKELFREGSSATAVHDNATCLGASGASFSEICPNE